MSLMSQVGEKTPISDHLEGTVLFNTGVWDMPPNQKKDIQILGNAILKI